MVTIWFESHSITTDNEKHIASGWNDADLSEDGVKKAAEWPERCKHRGLDAIFCSDTQRAVKSAMPTARELRLPIYIDERLRECNYGDFTQKSKELVDAQRPKRIKTPFPNGESYEQCMDRMKSFLSDLKKNFDGKTLLIVGHRATHYGIEHVSLGKPLEQCVSEKWKWQPGWEYQLK